mmetsp:Transcript_16519/g.45790  ORF Transcript_16519/g.45790 Transcript_16519/m.45790 type:complete len:373 (-) Transcript_16519:23-1141(-)
MDMSDAGCGLGTPASLSCSSRGGLDLHRARGSCSASRGCAGGRTAGGPWAFACTPCAPRRSAAHAAGPWRRPGARHGPRCRAPLLRSGPPPPQPEGSAPVTLPRGASSLAAVAVVVPFREQLPLQSRQAQLERFLPHMEAFLGSIPGCRSVIIVVEQTQDGRKFNRGQLLNIGFVLAKEALPGLTSFITHDVDLLPSSDMRPVYASPPPEGSAVHLAAVWTKYSYATFIGGVLAFTPEDFERTNGYPNNYWGWGLEDDQMALRMSHCRVKTLRVRRGHYEDLDPVNMKGFLDRGVREDIQSHLPWYNLDMFRRRELGLDDDWSTNGLRDLAHHVVGSPTVRGIVRHVVVELGGVEPGRAPGVVGVAGASGVS